jgi:hypothetical protein
MISDDVKFCPKCGTAVSTVQNPLPPRMQESSEIPAVTEPIEASGESVTQKLPKRKKLTPAVLLGALGAVVLVLGAVLVINLTNPGFWERFKTKGDSKSGENAATTTQTTESVGESNTAPEAYSATFGEYEEYTYEGKASVPEYKIDAGLSNVENYLQFSSDNRDWASTYGFWHSDNALTSEAIGLIEKNGFAVSDKYSWTEFFQLYESNRYNCVPNFITTDSAIHTFHLMFDYVLKDLEQKKLSVVLIQLSSEMTDASYEQYKELKGTSFENAALRNVAFFSVGSKLLNSGFEVPAEAKDIVSKELDLIEAHAAIQPSYVINLGADMESEDAFLADYTQYIPRSHYNQTEQLQRYFKAMMWYGQMTFRSKNEDEVKSALLQTSALTDEKLSGLWAEIFEPTNFFVGDCDDITYFQYQQELESVYGSDLANLSSVKDETKFAKAFEIIEKMPAPKINSVPIYDFQDKDSAITGFRFMGQRFTLDAYVFQNLIHDSVSGRMLPNSLDIPAAFGSDTALEILKDDTLEYPEYTEKMTELREGISEIPESVWSSNLYWSWMNMLRPFTDENDRAGYPLFMQNDAWTKKELNSFQGSWTELKHDTLLYAKASTAEMGGDGDAPAKPDDRGYVEPNPDVFGRLAALVNQTRTGLSDREILTDEADEALGVLYDLSVRLTEISEKELANEKLSDSDYDFIRTYGGELEHIWQTAKYYELSQTENEWTGEKFSEEALAQVIDAYLYNHPCGVAADVSTDPNGSVLEEATGYAKTIFVVFPRDGKLVLGSGTVFSQYEFTVPISERLTDEEWHERLKQNDIPKPADWKQSFMCDIGERGY